MKQRASFLQQELSRIDGHQPQAGLAKHFKMASNPFLFFRGSAQVFYADLANGTLKLPAGLTKLPLTTIMGDCHTSNFGLITEEGSHGDRVIFAPNDFDDACIAPAGWDLLRFATSMVLCASYCESISRGELTSEETDAKGKPSVTSSDARAALSQFLIAYYETCSDAIDNTDLYQHAVEKVSKSHILSKPFKKANARAYGGKQFTSKSSLAKAVDLTSEPLTFIDNPHRFRRLEKQAYQTRLKAFSPYVDDTVLDMVERLNAGTGSNNMLRYYLLVGPEKARIKHDLAQCHIVEVKQQRPAAPLYYFPDLSPVNQLNPAHLTARCQRRMQRAPDLLLDEIVWNRKHWLIRSRHHARVSIDPEDIGLGKKAAKGGFSEYAEICGQALALAHCRGDRRSVSFERAVVKQLPDEIDALISASFQYAEQVEQDRALLQTMLPETGETK